MAGLLAVLFNRAILVSLSLYRQFFRVGLPWRIGFAGLVAGLALATLPLALRDYAALRNLLLTGNPDWQLVGFLFCFQFLLIVISFGSGAPRGLLMPSLTLGAALGYLIGTWEQSWLGLSLATTYARVGMGTFFCGVARVPITGIIIVFKMTTDFNLVLPLMIGSVTAYLVGELVEKGSLYDHLLEFRGIHLSESATPQAPWAKLTAADVMQRKVETLAGQISLEEALQAFSQSSHRTFPVMENGRLVGMLTQKDLAKSAQFGLATAQTVATLMTPEPITVPPDDTLAHVLHLLDHYNVSSLPVLEGRRLVRIITRSDIIRVEAAHLNGEENLAAPSATASQIIYQTRSPETGQGRLLLPLSNPKTAGTLLKLAIAIACERHYEIECLHIVVVPRHQSPAAAAVSTAAGQRLLRQAMQQAQAWQIPIHTQIRVTHDLSSAVLQSIQDRHIDLVLMGWKGSTATPRRIFSRAVDSVIRQAACDVVLVKLQEDAHFDRWFVSMSGGSNAQQAIRLLPALSTLSKAPEIALCQVFEASAATPDMTILEKAAHFLQQHLKAPVTAIPICAKSIPEAILDCAHHHHSQVIIMGASREGLLQQIVHGNIPAAVAHSNNQTIVLVRSG